MLRAARKISALLGGFVKRVVNRSLASQTQFPLRQGLRRKNKHILVNCSTNLMRYYLLELEDIFTFENLLDSHKRCRACKQHKRETVNFEMNISENLLKLRNDILSNNYKLNKNSYRSFEILEPKKRVIESLSYKHRVVQNCLCHYSLMPQIEPRLIYDNGACRMGKGTHFCLKRFKNFLRDYYSKNGNSGYVLKCDVKKYFLNIDHEVLLKLLKKCKFSKSVYNFLKIIIESNNSCKGLPIGNQSSQWFGLLYLNPIDRLIKETFKVKYYVRYMDDLVIIHKNKNFLKSLLQAIIKLGEKLKLEFNAKTKISRICEGIEFLGFRHNLLNNGSVRSFLRKAARIKLKINITLLFNLKGNEFFRTLFINRLKCFKEHLSYGETFIYFNNLKLRMAS